jgi:hypothetical protein
MSNHKPGLPESTVAATRGYMYSVAQHGSGDVVRHDPVFDAGVAGDAKKALKHIGEYRFSDFLDRYIMGCRFGGTGRRERSDRNIITKQRRRREMKGDFDEHQE